MGKLRSEVEGLAKGYSSIIQEYNKVLGQEGNFGSSTRRERIERDMCEQFVRELTDILEATKGDTDEHAPGETYLA